MPAKRTDRLNPLFLRELSDLVRRGVKDPDLGVVSISGVDVSPDLSQARVYVSAIGEEDARKESLAALIRARGWLRTQLGKRLRIKKTPALHFVLDDSFQYGAHIEEVLGELDPSGGEGEGDDA